MTTKRLRENTEVEELAMANCMMLVSNIPKTNTNTIPDRIFSCKTCSKQFSSFQALGGHRASHKRPRLMAADHHGEKSTVLRSIGKPRRAHECSICGAKFATGQALGGHKRRHRDELMEAADSRTQSDTTTVTLSAETPSDSSQENNKSGGEGSRGLFLDLNLTPYENDLKFGRLHSFISNLK